MYKPGPYTPADGRRCHSAPPYALRDIRYNFHHPVQPGSNSPLLEVDYSLLGKETVADLHPTPSGRYMQTPVTRVLLLGHSRVLKMFPILVGVAAIVRFMRAAAAVIPVPKVLEFGYSGNCGYIVYEYIEGHVFSQIVRQHGEYATAMIESQVDAIVQRLAKLGIAHNDLASRNIIVDDNYHIKGIIDWDLCSSLYHAHEYGYRIYEDTLTLFPAPRVIHNGPSHRLNHIFLRHCLYPSHEILSFNSSDGTDFPPYRHPPCHGLLGTLGSRPGEYTSPWTRERRESSNSHRIALVLNGSGK